MNRIFYGRLISSAKCELKNLDHLLIRATNGFLAEKSIDDAIEHLKKTQEHLAQAKKVYSTQVDQSTITLEQHMLTRLS